MGVRNEVLEILNNLAIFLKSEKKTWKILNVLHLTRCLRYPLLLFGILGFNKEVLHKSHISEKDLKILKLLISKCYLYPYMRKLITELLNKKPTTVELDDRLFYIEDVEDLLHASMCYEAETLGFIESNVSLGGVFVDVGANIGGYTVRLARKSKVYAFEPEPRNYSLLVSNLKLNNLAASTYDYAISDTSGMLKLHTSEYHGRHSIEGARSSKAGRNHARVKAFTLDDILLEEDPIDVLKIDVEGAEPKVLGGALNTLAKTKFVVVEGGTSQQENFVYKFLVNLGFRYLEKRESNLLFASKTEKGCSYDYT